MFKRIYFAFLSLSVLMFVSSLHAQNVYSVQQPKVEKMTGSKIVKFVTNLGSFTVELDPEAAPVTVANFLQYVDSGYYNGTIFHRVIGNFMVQGGGFDENMTKKPTNPPIVLEVNRGLSNLRGTIAMARTGDPDSATSQFFINVVNNVNLDTLGKGYAVFGKVIEGMDTIDVIKSVQTTNKGPHANVPVSPVIIQSAKRL